ncbi:MAG: S9 family peptidase [Candidatus Nanoarchaeia archaeon]
MQEFTINNYLEIKRSAAPSFSFDRTKIAYLHNETGTFQLYLMNVDGTNIEQLTFYQEPLSFAAFSPVKNEILFGMAEGGNEKTQFYLLNVETRQIKQLTTNLNAMHRLGSWTRDGTTISYASNITNGTDFHIYTLNLETEKETCVYNQPGWHEALSFSPDGTKIGIAKITSISQQELFIIDLLTKEEIYRIKGKEKSQYGSPIWLNNNREFYFIHNDGTDFMNIHLFNLETKQFTPLLSFNWDIEGATLTRDNNHLALLINEEGYSILKIYETATWKELPSLSFPKGITNSLSWSKNSTHLAFTFESATKPCDIWTWNKETNETKQLTFTKINIPLETFIEPQLIRYPSFDDLSIPAFLYLPKNKTNAPALVTIHGGPEGQYTPNFTPLFQYFLSKGYAIIAPNVRGSTGYGKKYLALDDREKRMDSVKDLEYLHIYLQQVKEIDSNKVALWGGSYGGFMVLAGLTFQPDLWVAGVDIVGISNFVTFLQNTSPYRRALREEEYGSLEKDKKFLESISPFNFIEQIKSPLMIIHGSNDPRVPLTEAEQIHHKLKELGRDVQLLVYPDEGHGLAKLKNRLDAYPKVAEFLEKHFEII